MTIAHNDDLNLSVSGTVQCDQCLCCLVMLDEIYILLSERIQLTTSW